MATTKKFVAKNGLDNNNQPIVNVADPQNDQDVATKKSVDTVVSAEVTARTAAVTSVQSNINAEVTSRIAAVAAVQANVNAEITSRVAAVATLQANIDAEATARAADVSTLQSSIDTLDGNISALGNAFNYIGTISGGATEGSPLDMTTLASGQKDAGDYFKVSLAGYFKVGVGGTVFYANVGDGLVWNTTGSVDVIDNTNSSVSGTTNFIAVTGAADTGFVVDVAGTFKTRVTTAESDILAEKTARTNADTTLQSNINTVSGNLNSEITSRTNADTTLQNNINAEITARTGADTTLQSNINTVTSNLNTEVTARTNADTTLQSNINAEITARTAADSTLTSNLNIEVTARTNADTTLQSNINTVSGNLNAEITARTNADTTLQNNINAKQDAATAITTTNIGSQSVASAATLTTGRTIALTGDVAYTSAAFNGSANVTGAATLASVGTAGTYTKVTTDAKGRVTSGTTLAASDIPALDAAKITTGTIDAARLPSYVDDVIEGANLAAFPATGETGKIYVALDTNKTYRWSGSAYVYITSGAVDSVAGKTGVVTLVKGDVGLGSVDNTADSAKSVASAATLTTGRTIALTGDVTYTSGSFNGSANVTGAATLANSGVTAGSYGGSTAIPVLSIDAKGRVTSASTSAITVGDGTLTLATSGIATGSQTFTANQATAATFTVNVPGTNIAEGTRTTTAVPITSSTGTGATLSAASTTLAGVMTSADKVKLDGIAAGAQVNVATNLGITAGTTSGPIVTSSTGTSATLPTASGTASGVVTTGDQTWAGVKTFNSTIVGSISGNAGTVTNGVVTTGSYADPSWITSLAGSKISGNIAGSAATLTTGRTIALTGDVTYTSGSFDGSANVTGAATLASVGTAGTYTKVTTDAKGRVTSGTTLAATDIPNLDAAKITTGTIDAARLPSYVDDVIEGTNLAAFPATGETGKIYVALDTNKTYRWSGSTYVFITSGAVDSVAGKTGVVTLVKGDVGLGSVDNTADSAKSVASAAVLTTARTISGVSFNGSANITLNTSGITENTNLYYTDTRSRAALSFVAGSGAYNSTTGVITIPTNTNQLTNGAGYTTNTGTVTSVGGTGTVSGLTLSGTVTTTGNLTLGGTLAVTASNFASQLANTVLAAPNGVAGVPTFRTLVAADVPTLNQNTTGSAATLTTGRTIALTGDVTYTSGSFDGSGNVTGTATLASVGTAGTYTKVTTDAKGRVTSGATLAAADIPSLDASKITSGTIDAARLPSYVDDVVEGANLAAFPATGETGKIYVALDTNKVYRWSGTVYVYITSGAVDSVAGKTGVVTLVKGDVGLGSVDNTADSAKSVASAAILTTGRTIAITGDLAYTSPSFNGSGNVTAAGTLATVNANVGSFTNASLTVNAKGLITAASSGTAPVTSVTGTSPIVSSGGTTPAISIASGYGDTQNPYASKTANTVLAAPTGVAGVPTFRALVAADVPTLNQNTTGTAANVTGTVAIANGGTGATTQQGALNAVAGAVTSGSYLRGNGTNVAMSAIQAADVPTLNQNTTGTAANVTGTVAIANGGTGATTAAGARTNLGATTLGGNLFTVTNVAAIAFPRINADNTVSTLDAATFRTAIGAGTSSTTGTVTSVGGTGTVSGLTLSGTVTSTGNLTLSGTLAVTASNFASQTANTVLAAPTGVAGVPTFRALVAADVPTLNQNTTGSAATLTTGRTIALTGDVTYTSGSFNGSADVTGTATLASVGTAGTYTKVTTDAKGRVTSGTTLAAADIPSLDASKITTGIIDAARLPSYVDDVIEGANLAAFPATGEVGKIYVALDTNKVYRWSGTVYVYITSGAVDSVAGKTGVVTLVKGDVGLGNVDNTADSAKSVASAAILTTARTIGGVSFDGSANINLPGVNAAGNQNTTGTASNVTGTVAIANGGTGATTAAAARTNLGATTLGGNLFTVTNVAAISFPRINADNTVSTLDAATFRTAIGAGTSSTTGTVTSVAALTIGTAGTDVSSTVATGTTTPVITLNIPTASAANRGVLSSADWTTFNNKTSNTGTVTSVGGTGTVSGLSLSGTVTSTGNLTLGGTLAVTASNFASQTANTVLAAPSGVAGVPTFRTLVAADVPTLNQNTTGTASNVTGTVAIANGGTGATTAAGARTNLGATTLGSNLFGLANVAAISFPRINADNTVSSLDAATFRTAIGAGTSSTTYVAGNGLTLTGATFDVGAGSYITVAADSIAVDATSANTVSKVVARDGNGDFAGRIITATQFNGTSDIRLKSNVETMSNASEVLMQLRPVGYTMNSTGETSYGLIAQDLEQILPELVSTNEDGFKSVSYIPLIAFLIETVQSQQKVIEDMKTRLDHLETK